MKKVLTKIIKKTFPLRLVALALFLALFLASRRGTFSVISDTEKSKNNVFTAGVWTDDKNTSGNSSDNQKNDSDPQKTSPILAGGQPGVPESSGSDIELTEAGENSAGSSEQETTFGELSKEKNEPKAGSDTEL